jgi:hypothetical protein
MVKLKSSLRQFTVATMSVMEFLCHKLQPICSICHNHNPVLSPFMTYCQLCRKSNKTGATYGAGIAYPQRTTKFTSGFYWVARSFVFFVMFSRSLFVLLDFFIWSLCCLFFFDLTLMVAPLVFSNISYHGMDI